MRCIQSTVGQVLAMGGDGLRSSEVLRDVFWLLATDMTASVV